MTRSTIAVVQVLVAQRFGLRVAELRTPGRQPALVRVRNAAIWLARALSGALHPWAVLLGIKARPSDIRPTAGQVRYLRARGINPAGLSRPEAKAMQGLLQLRKGEAMAWPRQMERFIAAHGWGERLARACAAGMIDDGLRGSIEHLRQLAMSAYFELMAVRRSRTVH